MNKYQFLKSKWLYMTRGKGTASHTEIIYLKVKFVKMWSILVLFIEINNHDMEYHFRPIYIKTPVLIKMYFSWKC